MLYHAFLGATVFCLVVYVSLALLDPVIWRRHHRITVQMPDTNKKSICVRRGTLSCRLLSKLLSEC